MSERSNMERIVMERIVEHLELVGYTVSREREDFYIAKHPHRYNISLLCYRIGFLIRAIFGKKEGARQEWAADFVNRLNQKAFVARFYVDEDGDLNVEAFWPYFYDRTTFGTFLDVWERDLDRMVEIYREFIGSRVSGE